MLILPMLVCLIPVFPQLELFLSSGTVCLSIYSLVAAMFGMNIPYPWNEGHGYIFKWVSTACISEIFQVVVCLVDHLLVYISGGYINGHGVSLRVHVNNDLCSAQRSHWILIIM